MGVDAPHGNTCATTVHTWHKDIDSLDDAAKDVALEEVLVHHVVVIGTAKHHHGLEEEVLNDKQARHGALVTKVCASTNNRACGLHSVRGRGRECCPTCVCAANIQPGSMALGRNLNSRIAVTQQPMPFKASAMGRPHAAWYCASEEVLNKCHSKPSVQQTKQRKHTTRMVKQCSACLQNPSSSSSWLLTLEQKGHSVVAGTVSRASMNV